MKSVIYISRYQYEIEKHLKAYEDEKGAWRKRFDSSASVIHDLKKILYCKDSDGKKSLKDHLDSSDVQALATLFEAAIRPYESHGNLLDGAPKSIKCIYKIKAIIEKILLESYVRQFSYIELKKDHINFYKKIWPVFHIPRENNYHNGNQVIEIDKYEFGEKGGRLREVSSDVLMYYIENTCKFINYNPSDERLLVFILQGIFFPSDPHDRNNYIDMFKMFKKSVSEHIEKEQKSINWLKLILWAIDISFSLPGTDARMSTNSSCLSIIRLLDEHDIAFAGSKELTLAEITRFQKIITREFNSAPDKDYICNFMDWLNKLSGGAAVQYQSVAHEACFNRVRDKNIASQITSYIPPFSISSFISHVIEARDLDTLKLFADRDPEEMNKVCQDKINSILENYLPIKNSQVLEWLMSDEVGMRQIIDASDRIPWGFAQKDSDKRWFARYYADRLDELIRHDNFASYINALKFGEIDSLDFLKQSRPSLFEEFLLAHPGLVVPENYSSFKWLLKNAPDEYAQAMIRHSYVATNKCLKSAQDLKDLKTIQKMTEICPGIRHDIFVKACKEGNVYWLDFLKQDQPGSIGEILKVYPVLDLGNHYSSFKWLLENADDDYVRAMLVRNKKKTKEDFKKAAANGDLAILQKIIEVCPEMRHTLIRSQGAECGRRAIQFNQWEVVRYLLDDSRCLSMIDSIVGGGVNRIPYLTRYLDERVAVLRDRSEAAERGTFDLTESDEIEHALVMVKAFLRLPSTADINGNIYFLLSIPAVRLRAHEAVGISGRPNELLRFSRQRGNALVMNYLVAIEAVRLAAEEASFYPEDQVLNQGPSLREIAENRESSMRGLTEEENRRIGRARKYYGAMIKQVGAKWLVHDLHEAIGQFYEKHPARFEDENNPEVPIILPLDYESFSDLNLSPGNHNKALSTYHEHYIHTAYRYLMKPNSWMHVNAGYVIRDEHGRGWSTFERYEDLLALLWLAVQDMQHVEVPDFPLDTKFEEFLRNLALINRAHNWDQYGTRDDNEGDRPSCDPGTPRRLFQSVPGNPLLRMLTMEIIEGEIREFAFEQFKAKLTDDNIPHILEAMTEYGIERNNDESILTTLASLNIDPQAIEAFKVKLADKYENEYTESIVLKRIVNRYLDIDPNHPEIPKRYHLGGHLLALTSIYSYLDRQNNRIIEVKAKASVSAQGVFAPTPKREDDQVVRQDMPQPPKSDSV